MFSIEPVFGVSSFQNSLTSAVSWRVKKGKKYLASKARNPLTWGLRRVSGKFSPLASASASVTNPPSVSQSVVVKSEKRSVSIERWINSKANDKYRLKRRLETCRANRDSSTA